MCTAISFQTKDHYFGRNLDLEHAFHETVTITPRNYHFHFCNTPDIDDHFAMIGMATVVAQYPLYYDATNEYGLSIAGLNFPGNAVYLPVSNNKTNVASFEFIPWILCQYKTVSDVRKNLNDVNLTNIAFSDKLLPSPLHWIISDRLESIVVEPTAGGLKVWDNPVGILTNNPPFDFHMYHLSNYLNLTREEPINRFSDNTNIKPYSRGMGGIGLPGDLSSSSRFIRAAFTKLNSICDQTEDASVSQFFHILSSVEQQRGCVCVGDKFEITLYSSCCNTNKGIYYYTTYDNRQITAVCLHNEDLNGGTIVQYPLITNQQIRMQN